VLLQSVETLAPPAHDLLQQYAEVVVVRGMEDGAAFRAAMSLTAGKWPGVTLWSASPGGSARPVHTK